ncbi:MAG: glycosyltransferase [PVC group bacterium]
MTMALSILHYFFSGAFAVFLYLSIAVSFILFFISAVVICWRKKSSEMFLDPGKAPTVTVQIPTRNEIIALRCARMCLESDYPLERLQVLIGDDSDQPEISRQIDAFATRHPRVEVTRRADRSGFKPGNLNHMLKQSRGEIVIIFDSDFMPAPDFISRIVSPFVHDPEIASVQARWDFTNSGENLATVMGSTMGYSFHQVFLPFMNIFGCSFICGSAEAVKKSVLLELGGWRPGILTEDIEFSLRMIRNNQKMIYLPGLSCLNEVPQNAADLYRQQMRWAHGVISAYVIHFRGILTSRRIGMKRKLFSMFSGLGYVFPVLIAGLIITSILSIITTPPTPVAAQLSLSEAARNVLLTSGLLFMSVVALFRARQIKLFFRMIISSFSIGLVAIFFVLKGILSALLKRPMAWHLIRKSTDYREDYRPSPAAASPRT